MVTVHHECFNPKSFSLHLQAFDNSAICTGEIAGMLMCLEGHSWRVQDCLPQIETVQSCYEVHKSDPVSTGNLFGTKAARLRLLSSLADSPPLSSSCRCCCCRTRELWQSIGREPCGSAFFNTSPSTSQSAASGRHDRTAIALSLGYGAAW